MKRFMLPAVLAFFVLSCVSGCFGPMNTSDNPPSSSIAQTSEKQIESETDSGAADSGNPVRSLYKRYSDDTEDRSLLFQDALDSDASLVCTEASLRLCEHSALLSEGLLTLGWLLPADDGTYASAITGALAGSGAIAETGNAFALHYSYENGKSATGTLQDNRLVYSCYDPAGNLLHRVTILGEEGAWLSLTESQGTFTLLCFQSDIRLLAGPCPASVSTSADANMTIAQILNDYSGSAQISLLYSKETSSLTQEAG